MRRNAGPLSLAAGLIALYLIVKNPGGVSNLVKGVPDGVKTDVMAFQGRG